LISTFENLGKEKATIKRESSMVVNESVASQDHLLVMSFIKPASPKIERRIPKNANTGIAVKIRVVIVGLSPSTLGAELARDTPIMRMIPRASLLS
jgi:hypothetical protein